LKIGLGTAQFGLNYGISTKEGQTQPIEIVKILEVAKDYHISLIDTAALYGNSEEVLGRLLPRDHNFKLVTKTIRIDSSPITEADADRLESAFESSLEKLRSRTSYGLMFHNSDDLLAEGGERLMRRLQQLKQNGLVTKIGASVYTADQIDKILSRYEIDLIQIPMNVLDQRLLAGSQLTALKAKGVEIHVRSAFLQGLLLMEPETIPGFFDPVREKLKGYHEFIRENGITPIQAALGFLSACDEVDVIVCGVNNHQQLIELCQATGQLPQVDFSSFAIDDDNILNPSMWRIA
jgi:aryl-alcohol dehydrogenase-like predicted oxidoreductase